MIVLRQHLVDYHRASPTPALDYGSEYFLLGVYWSTPTDAVPSCVTNTAIFGQVRTTFPSHPAYDLQSLKIMQPRIDQVMSGFPRLFTDIPYIAQCAGAARRSRRPGYLSKASFLTSTQTVITTGAIQTPAPSPATVAQPQDSPVPSSVVSSVAASKIQRPISAAHGLSIEPAQPPTSTEPGIQKLEPFPAPIFKSPPSKAATNLALTADGKPAATAPGVRSTSLWDGLVPEAPVVTISNTAVSLAPAATAITLGSNNAIDPDRHRAPIYITPAPGIIATPTNIPIVVINGQTLIPGASSPRTITVMNIPVHASGSYIIYGTSIIPISAIATAIPHASAFTSQVSALVIGSQTLIPGGSAVTLGYGSGTTRILSLESGGSSMAVVSGGQGTTSVAVEWLGGVPGQSLGASGTASQTQTVQMYTGSAARSDRCIGLILGIVTVIAYYPTRG
jgi:hypothetical protein